MHICLAILIVEVDLPGFWELIEMQGFRASMLGLSVYKSATPPVPARSTLVRVLGAEKEAKISVDTRSRSNVLVSIIDCRVEGSRLCRVNVDIARRLSFR